MFENARSTTCIHFDVNGMQALNDKHGWDSGDKLLAGIVSVLEECFPAPCDVTRLSGDEFLIMTRDSDAELSTEHARIASEEIQNRFAANVTFGIGCGISASEARRFAAVALFESRARQ